MTESLADKPSHGARGQLSIALLMVGLLAAAWPMSAAAVRTAAQREGDTAVAPPSEGEQRAEPFKFTTGLYRSAGGDEHASTGLDLNLRYNGSVGDLWLGWFRAPTGAVSQARGGWDRTYAMGAVRLQPSLQLASGGFVGGSLNAETGEHWYVGGGLGRTNLRDYVNLNFDPNDAWMLSAGYRWSDAQYAGLQVVRDNRLHPDQQHVHLVMRLPVHDGQALAIDLLDKRGTVDDGYIHRTGASVTYGWPQVFVRVAYDPKVNFTRQTQWRLSAGTRF